MGTVVNLSDYRKKNKDIKLIEYEADVYYDNGSYNICLEISNIEEENYACNLSNLLQCIVMMINNNVMQGDLNEEF